MPEGVDPKENFKDYVLGTYDGQPKDARMGRAPVRRSRRPHRLSGRGDRRRRQGELLRGSVHLQDSRRRTVRPGVLHHGPHAWRHRHAGPLHGLEGHAAMGNVVLACRRRRGGAERPEPPEPSRIPGLHAVPHSELHDPGRPERVGADWSLPSPGSQHPGRRVRPRLLARPASTRSTSTTCTTAAVAELPEPDPQHQRRHRGHRARWTSCGARARSSTPRASTATSWSRSTSYWEQGDTVYSGEASAIFWTSTRCMEPSVRVQDAVGTSRKCSPRSWDVDPKVDQPRITDAGARLWPPPSAPPSRTPPRARRSRCSPSPRRTSTPSALAGTPQEGVIELAELKEAGHLQVPGEGRGRHTRALRSLHRRPRGQPAGHGQRQVRDLLPHAGLHGQLRRLFHHLAHRQVADRRSGAGHRHADRRVSRCFLWTPHSVAARPFVAAIHVTSLREAFPQECFMSTVDAEARGIKNGDTVLMSSPYGKVLRPAKVMPTVVPGAVALQDGCVDPHRRGDRHRLGRQPQRPSGAQGLRRRIAVVDRHARAGGEVRRPAGARARQGVSRRHARRRRNRKGGPSWLTDSTSIPAAAPAASPARSLARKPIIWPRTTCGASVYNYQGGTWKQNDKGTYVPEGVFGYFVSIACNHCDDPACVANCPTGAMHEGRGHRHREHRPGNLHRLQDLLHRCARTALPPSWRKRASPPSATCAPTRSPAGRVPICVATCPMRALDWGDIDELRQKYGEGNVEVEPLPENTTSPCLVLDPHPAAQATGPGHGQGREPRRRA